MPADTSIIRPTCYRDSNDAGIAQLVERDLAKVEVAGSNPVSRSNLSHGFKYGAR